MQIAAMMLSKQQAASSKQQAASSKQQAASSKQQAASSKPEVIASAAQYIEGTDTEKARYEALLWESGLFVMTLQ